MFVDASAICAVLLDEPDGAHLDARIEQASSPLTSALAAFEATLAIARERNGDVAVAAQIVQSYLRASAIELVDIGDRELERAVDAFDRFGKGRHPARLNLGDCFAYACAKTNGVPLLYKGDDFRQTDVTPA